MDTSTIPDRIKRLRMLTSDALTRAHTLVTSVCTAAAAGGHDWKRGHGMMKVSRSIRKECNRVILIAFAATMLAVCISPALASATYIPPDPTNLTNTTGCYWVNYTWQAGSGWYLIAGGAGGGFYGYNWTGSAWKNGSAIAGDLSDVGNSSAPTVFQKDGTWYLIVGGSGAFHGYNWTGSAWQIDGAIVAGLPPGGGNYSAPTVFRKNGTWYLIVGGSDAFHGYNWTASAWQSDDAIVSGLPDVWDRSAPTVFQKDGDWYLIVGGSDAFHGYNWTISAWQSDDAIASTPPDVENYSAPTVFQKDGDWYLIAGDFRGYNWTGSAWQSDSAIVSGLPDVGDNSTLAVFDMGNVTDSYNISVNGVWHNGTNTSINKNVSSGVWVNITVWAWNASGTGTLSSGYVSDNVLAGLGSTFGLVGSVPTGGGGTYPPGWFGTPTPSTTATVAPPGERVTPVPTKAKPAAAKATAPAAEGTTAGTAKKGAPGFTAVFAIAGMLAVAYAMMRQR